MKKILIYLNRYMNNDISPVQWMNTKVSQPAYSWLIAFSIVSISSFSLGCGLGKYLKSIQKE